MSSEATPAESPILDGMEEASEFTANFVNAAYDLVSFKTKRSTFDHFMKNADHKHFHKLQGAEEKLLSVGVKSTLKCALVLAELIGPLRISRTVLGEIFWKFNDMTDLKQEAWSILRACDPSLPKLRDDVLAFARTESDFSALLEDNSRDREKLSILQHGLVDIEFRNTGKILEHVAELVSSATKMASRFYLETHRGYYPFPYFCIVQRSGTGKTKLLIELGRKVHFSVYISLRGFTKSPENIVAYIQRLSRMSKDIAETQATQLLLSIIQYARKEIKRLSKENKSEAEIREGFLGRFLPGSQTSFAVWETIIDTAKDINPRESVRDLFDTMEQSPLLISIDEASVLIGSDNAAIALKALRRAACDLQSRWPDGRTRPFFLLFADTNAKITNFAPTTGRDPSLRLYEPTGDLYPPFYGIMTQDLFAESYLAEVDQCVKQYQNGNPVWYHFLIAREAASDMRGFVNLGSPIWYTTRIADPWQNLSHFACAKLLANDYPLASIACRTSLTINPSCHLASEMVASCMARLDFLSQDLSIAHVSYPSDPILASGGADYTMSSWLEALESLYNSLFKKHVIAGDLGELVAEILLLAAFDKASETKKNFMSVSVREFFAHFLSPQAFEEMLLSFPMTYQMWDGRMFFNHFVRLGAAPTPDDLGVLFARGAAALGFTYQAGICIFIPFILPSGEISAVYIQVKNHRDFMQSQEMTDIYTKMKANEVHSTVKLSNDEIGPHVVMNLRQGESKEKLIEFENRFDRLQIRLEGFNSDIYRMNWDNPDGCLNTLSKILMSCKGVEAFAADQLTETDYRFLKNSGFWETGYSKNLPF